MTCLYAKSSKLYLIRSGTTGTVKEGASPAGERKKIVIYYDVISPYAWFGFEVSVAICYSLYFEVIISFIAITVYLMFSCI